MSGGSIEIFITFVVIGLLLVAVEVIIPGGIVGAIGALCLLIAVIMAFFVFPPPGGMIAALCLVIGGIVFMIAWLKLFPRTSMGRKLTLSRNGKDFHAFADDASLLGKEGVASSALRPSGIALIEGKRMDVVAEAGFIPEGAQVKVIQVEGNRIIVRAKSTT